MDTLGPECMCVCIYIYIYIYRLFGDMENERPKVSLIPYMVSLKEPLGGTLYLDIHKYVML